MLKKLCILLFILLILFIVYYFSCKTPEGFDGYNPNDYTLPPGILPSGLSSVFPSLPPSSLPSVTPGSLPSPTPSVTPGVTPGSLPSPTPSTLNTIQNFIITRSNFSDSINQMIVFLSAKNNYQDLILKLSNIQATMNNL